ADARGGSNRQVEVGARACGFCREAFEGPLDRATTELRQGRPIIVLQDLRRGPVSVPHFAVLVGYDDRSEVVVLHSGTTAFHVLSYAEFLRTWAVHQSWSLLITPRGPAA